MVIIIIIMIATLAEAVSIAKVKSQGGAWGFIFLGSDPSSATY